MLPRNRLAQLLICTVIALGSPACHDHDCIRAEDLQSVLDKEIRIPFPFDYTGSDNPVYAEVYDYTILKNFSKNDFSHIDSIFFICQIGSADANTISVRLIDLRSNTVIANSELIQNTMASVDIGYYHKKSQNILNDLPVEHSDLGIQIRSKTGRFAYARGAHLLLKRN